MNKLLLLLLLTSMTVLNAKDKITPAQLEFFETKIRPVLAESCYECHNSVNKKKGKLALDWREPMLKGGSEGLAVVPGKPEESLLIKSIRHEDDLEMPSKAPKLSDAVIADFVKWIEMGAPDPRTEKPTKEDLETSVKWDDVRDKRAKWWSFQPLKYSIPAKPEHREWQKNTIDAFVFAKLKSLKLKPSEEADKYTLLRRLHLILTGLPPQEQDITEFLADKSPNAYEKQVDKLLAKKEFGEKWARHWMDWYRYSNTHGSEGDPNIPFSEEYRDYLIRALNKDVPYKQLIKEHIAGDLLDNPRINSEMKINESAIGPAHFRMTPIGFGVTDAYDEQVNVIDNQVDVMTKAMLGLTVSCARCHNHKFDPISQKDFTRFYGIMLSNKQSTVLINTNEKLQKNKKEIARLKKDIRRELADFWLTQVDKVPHLIENALNKASLPRLKPLEKGKKLSRKEKNERKEEERKIREANQALARLKRSEHPFSLMTLKKNEKKLPEIVNSLYKSIQEKEKKNEEIKKNATYYLDFRDPKNSDKYYISGNGIDGISPAGSFALNNSGDGAVMGIYPAGIYSHMSSTKHAAVLSTNFFKVQDKNFFMKVAGRDSQSRTPIRNYPLSHGGLHPNRILNSDNISWQNAPGRWSYWVGDMAHFELRTAKEIYPRSGGDNSWFGITELYIGNESLAEESISLLSVIKDPQFIKDAATIDSAYKETVSSILKKWAVGTISDKEAKFLQPFVLNNILSNKISEMPKKLQEMFRHYRQLEKEIPVPRRAPGLQEAEVVDQRLMTRGDYKKQEDPVERQFLEIFSNKKYSKANSGRLELAEDMVAKENTLKSRVLVNRLWSYVFGQGIVKSTDNFGRLGSKPTHPQLLDYLAKNFEKNNWSIKSALRQMVTSRTFKSRSISSAKADDIDPENIYLSYFTPRRLNAEAIHDTLLTLSENNFKRAVYDRVVRNRLNPFLTTFNRPTPVSTVSSRLSTNVPAQALTMMNDFTVNISAKVFNRALYRKQLQTDDEKIKALFIHCYGRPASDMELELCKKFLQSSNSDWNRLTESILNSREIIYVY